VPTNSSATLSINFENLALETVGTSLSAPVVLQVIFGPLRYLSMPVGLGVVAVPVDTLSMPVEDVASYIDSPAFTNFTTYIGDQELMPDIIQIAENSSINVTTLVMTNKDGTGDCVMVPPSGSAFQLKGMRVGMENLTANYTIPQHKSGYVWTNVSATGTITATLPSGARIGTVATFLRTGPAIAVSVVPNARIWLSASGYFRPNGQAVTLASSGAKLSLMCDGNNGWYPQLEEGTIS
jgi:hypothetical protein